MEEKLVAVHSSLTWAAALRITEAALRLRVQHAVLPLAVAVLDAGGNLVSFQREDGCGVLRFRIAQGKAWGALGMGMSTRQIRDRLRDRPAFQEALAVASDGRFIPTPGGVLIRAEPDGPAVGAVGISGDTSDKDEFVAIQAVREAGLWPDPLEPAAQWNASVL